MARISGFARHRRAGPPACGAHQQTPLKFLTACITGAPLPTDEPDWDSLLQLADYHRLTPLLARAMRAHPKPASLDDALRSAARVNARRRLLLFAHSARPSAAPQSHALAAPLVEGPRLAQQICAELRGRRRGARDA